MSSDESSDLSSVPSDDELQLTKKDGILKFFSKAPPKETTAREASPPRPKRDPSPPHEFVLADNPDIAFIVMFRSRFTEAFPKSLPNFGPQELERDIIDTVPGEGAEQLLCAILGLLLNRKQDVKAGHYNRALEEAIQTHKSQWPQSWEKNPLSGGATFSSMAPTERLTLLRNLILWTLSSSDVVRGILQASYKQTRHEDDLNQPLSVQPWGADSDKRRYYLIEGLDDTHFRVYRESNYMGLKRTWWSVAADLDELKALAGRLQKEDGGQKARILSSKIMAAIPRFEGTEEKRKRREYRQTRKQQFKRPELNYSMYEGRTRGKRMKYTYSDEEDDMYSDSTNTRRSTRNTGTRTSAEPTGPTITQSGRQVKARQGGVYGESVLSGGNNATASVAANDEAGEGHEELNAGGRPQRAAAAQQGTNGWSGKAKGGRHIEGYNDVDEMTSDEEGDASEQDYGDDEEEDDHVSLQSDVNDPNDLTDDDEEMADGDEPQKMIIKLPVKTPTPERKSMVRVRLTPSPEHDKEATTQAEDSVELSSKAHASFSNTASLADTKAHNQPMPSPHSEVATHASKGSSKPVSIPPRSPASQQLSRPESPLAFRGSPEKPAAVPAVH